MGNLYGRD
ncbi:hypothetical protein CFP56_019382 [Quercus suber]|uniref:Uncharacterized protein n=1 Tax=Quercus suber TaxID=58331 RepID=A0AAW0KIE7_QUESU